MGICWGFKFIDFIFKTHENILCLDLYGLQVGSCFFRSRPMQVNNLGILDNDGGYCFLAKALQIDSTHCTSLNLQEFYDHFEIELTSFEVELLGISCNFLSSLWLMLVGMTILMSDTFRLNCQGQVFHHLFQWLRALMLLLRLACAFSLMNQHSNNWR